MDPIITLRDRTAGAGAWGRAAGEALRAAGVEVGDREERQGLIVLLLDQADEPAIDSLRGISTGAGRAIVVSVGPLPIESAWRLLTAGASDVLPWTTPELVAARIKARLERWAEIDALVSSDLVREHVVGTGRSMVTCLRQVVEVAAFSDGPVLLLGESGTGKELLARLVHALDRRPTKKELVVLDCTTLSPELAGSELFGHEKGAFTGALAAREGAFALADGGTLFLDEVGELPLTIQAQLLRVIQEKTYKRVGGNQWFGTRFRLVCATNRDLPAEVDQRRFRRDLYHRIASRICRVPPLRERPEDILDLARHFLRDLRPTAEVVLDPGVEAVLLTRPYPGNVRDLRQLVARIGDRHVGPGPVSLGALPIDEIPSTRDAASLTETCFEVAVARALALGLGLKEIGRLATETATRLAITAADGNLQQAARRLGVTDRALQLRRAQRTDAAGA